MVDGVADDEEEESMDPDDEHEPIGRKLPPDEVKASFEGWLAPHPAQREWIEEDEAQGPEANLRIQCGARANKRPSRAQ